MTSDILLSFTYNFLLSSCWSLLVISKTDPRNSKKMAFRTCAGWLVLAEREPRELLLKADQTAQQSNMPLCWNEYTSLFLKQTENKVSTLVKILYYKKKMWELHIQIVRKKIVANKRDWNHCVIFNNCHYFYIYICKPFSMYKFWAASWQSQQNGMCTQQRLRSAWASD